MIHISRTQFRTSNVHRERVHTRYALAFTRLCDGNLSTSASYSGGPRFRSLSTDSDLPRFFSIYTRQSSVEKWEVKRSEVKWSEVKWSEVEWSGVEWSGVEWSGVEWSGVEWSGVEWSEVKWSEAKRSEVKWSEVKWSEVKWSEVKWSEVKWSEVKWKYLVKCVYYHWFIVI